MEVLNKILSTTEKVLDLLTRIPRLRDNHDALTSNYWLWELKCKGIDAQDLSAWKLLKMISTGELTSEETIQRARRKAQHDNPELRGQKYEERMAEEKDVRQNINK